MRVRGKLYFAAGTPFTVIAIRTALQIVRQRRRKVQFEIRQLEKEAAELVKQDAALTKEYGPQVE